MLAAGASSRFSGTKQLAEVGGQTLVMRVLSAIPSTASRETVLVLGHDSTAVGLAVANMKGVKVVVNADYRSGMGSSIKTGILALEKGTPGAMVMLADQPSITRHLLRRMLGEFEAKGEAGIVAAAHGGLVSPPVIFSRRYFRELTELEGDGGAKAVIERHPRALSLVDVRSTATLADIDTRDDLEKLRRSLEP